nr:hypothetical protein CFP56_00895 [Quercus suber]
MADSSGQELPYGHFGNPIYDPDENQWTFSRGLLPDSSIRSFDKPEILVQAPAVDHNSSGQAEKTLPVARRHSIQIRNLAHAIPELQPAGNILSSLLRRSEAVIAASTGYDPCRGSLLTFGSIPSESHHVPISVSAFTSGVCSQGLWLVERQLERRGWADTRCAWIDVPNLGCQRAYWCSNSGTIQEVRFSQTFDRAGATMENPSFMAVRCMTATTIFRPVLRGCTNDDVFQPNTKLDLSPVFDISIRETSNQMHADVAFNPWYSRQFAIISVAGDWDVWDLSGRRSHTHAKVSRRGLASKHRVPLTGDGWVRIMWISNPTTLLICTRSSLALYDISDEERVKVTAVDITNMTTASYIMGITLLPARPAYFCILTSTHLVIFHVQQMLGTAQEGVEVAIALKLTHFWNQGDSSLKMSLLEIDEQGE